MSGALLIGDSARLRAASHAALRGPFGPSPRDAFQALGFVAGFSHYDGILDTIKGAVDTGTRVAYNTIQSVVDTSPAWVGGAITEGLSLSKQFQTAMTQVDPSTPDGLRVISRWLPGPWNVLLGRAPDLMECQRRATAVQDDSARRMAIAECGIKHVLLTLFDFLSSPEFRIVLDSVTGNIPGAIVAGARLATDKLLMVISAPAVQSALGIGRNDFMIVESVLKLIVKSPDILMMMVEKGPAAVQESFFFQSIGGILQAVTTYETTVTDVGWLLAYNAEILSSFAKGDAARAEEWFDRLYVKPIQAKYDIPIQVKRSGGALGSVVKGLGQIVTHLGDFYGKVPFPAISQYVATPIRGVGQRLYVVGETIRTWLVGRPERIPPAIDWEGRIRTATAERDQARAERDRALRERDAARNVPTAGGAPASPSSFNIGGAIAGAGAGLLVGGPLGAAAGLFVGGRANTQPAVLR